MASPSSIITIGLNFTPSLIITLGYGAGASVAAAYFPPQFRLSRSHVGTQSLSREHITTKALPRTHVGIKDLDSNG